MQPITAVTSHAIDKTYLVHIILHTLRDICSIHLCSKLLPSLPTRWHTQSTMYLTSPLDCTTQALHTRHDYHTPAPHDLRKSSYWPSL